MSDHPPTGNFQPHVRYNPDADELEVWWEDASCHAEQWSGVLKVMFSDEGRRRAVGVLVQDIEALGLSRRRARGEQVVPGREG